MISEKNLDFLTPLPLVLVWNLFVAWNSCTLAYYLHFFKTLSPFRRGHHIWTLPSAIKPRRPLFAAVASRSISRMPRHSPRGFPNWMKTEEGEQEGNGPSDLRRILNHMICENILASEMDLNTEWSAHSASSYLHLSLLQGDQTPPELDSGPVQQTSIQALTDCMLTRCLITLYEYGTTPALYLISIDLHGFATGKMKRRRWRGGRNCCCGFILSAAAARQTRQPRITAEYISVAPRKRALSLSSSLQNLQKGASINDFSQNLEF